MNYEELLKRAIEGKNEFNSVSIEPVDDSLISTVSYLEGLGLITDVSYICKGLIVKSRLTYDGLHYFD